MAQTSKTAFPCDDDSGSMWPLQQQNDFVFVILSVLKVPLTKCNTAFPRVSGAMSDPPPPPPPPPLTLHRTGNVGETIMDSHTNHQFLGSP